MLKYTLNPEVVASKMDERGIFTVTELAERLDQGSRSYVQKIVRGKRPAQAKFLFALAELLGTHPAYLVLRETPEAFESELLAAIKDQVA